MIALLITVTRFIKVFRDSLDDERFRGLAYLVLILLGGGTYFYHWAEGWSYIDSFYFSVVSLTTVGYGDLSPKTQLGKLFTSIYLLVGVATLVSFGTHMVNLAAVTPGLDSAVMRGVKRLTPTGRAKATEAKALSESERTPADDVQDS